MAVKAKANSPAAAGELTARQRKRKENLKLVKRNYQLYFFLIPAVVFIAMFMYFPLYGLQIAFKNYRTGDGIWGSEWVGLKWFEQFFQQPQLQHAACQHPDYLGVQPGGQLPVPHYLGLDSQLRQKPAV